MSSEPHATRVDVHPNLAPEDRARGEFYAVLARLFARAPDAELLRLIAVAPELAPEAGDAALPDAWNRLRDASSVMEAEAADDEYTLLFIGVGRSEIELHSSHWIGAAKSEKPLVDVRADLARLGLSRLPDVNVYEDHLSVLLEAMRVLVLGAPGRAPATIGEQQAFFEAHITSWSDACCDAITRNPVANYYRCVAQLTKIMVAIERDAFAIQ
ncbi:MAG: molecular chaperone TorD family protein [Betaproteobacteria bacterium]